MTIQTIVCCDYCNKDITCMSKEGSHNFNLSCSQRAIPIDCAIWADFIVFDAKQLCSVDCLKKWIEVNLKQLGGILSE